jgi:hypothetical protein
MGRDRLEDPGVDRRIVRWIFKKWVVVTMNWIDLAEDRER